MQNLDSILSKKLTDRAVKLQMRDRICLESGQANKVIIDGGEYINFSSNDYLGLASHPATVNAIKQQLDQGGFGSGASHLITGHHQIHQKLENSLAEFLQRDSAITFSTGYMANLAILQSLANKGDLIIADKLNHASLIDGAKLSNADSLRYQHCDLIALESRLKKSAINKWVVTDSVFSMDGDIAPLDKIAGLCKKYAAHLIVDDAHGFGVLGEQGRGCIEHFGLSQSELPVLMGTFGKALGGFGAFVSGSKNLTSYLMQFARSYVYTTALPAAVAAANYCNLGIIRDNQLLRRKLFENINYFKSQCVNHKYKNTKIYLVSSNTAIQPIIVGESKKLIDLNRKLKDNGVLVGAIRPPTVAANSDRLRVTLSASHSFEEIDYLVNLL